METIKFRNLNAEEIDVRVGTPTKNETGNVTHFSFLLYKNARVDMAILDETFGVMNWQTKYYQVKSTMICSVGINVNYNDPTKEPLFIWKDNGGDDDFQTEQTKAECSDAFKRACFLIGIGRGLYSASKLYMRIEKTEDNTEKSSYGVSAIEYDDKGNITKVTIYNKKTKKDVLTATLNKKVSQNADLTPKTTEQKGFTKEDEKLVNQFQGFSDKKGSIDLHDKCVLEAYLNTADELSKNKFFNYIDAHYNTMSIDSLSEIQGMQLVEMLNAKKGRA